MHILREKLAKGPRAIKAVALCLCSAISWYYFSSREGDMGPAPIVEWNYLLALVLTWIFALTSLYTSFLAIKMNESWLGAQAFLKGGVITITIILSSLAALVITILLIIFLPISLLSYFEGI